MFEPGRKVWRLRRRGRGGGSHAARVVPGPHQRLEALGVPSEGEDLAVVGRLDGFVAMEGVRILPDGEPEIRPVERDVLETDGGPSRTHQRGDSLRIALEARERHARLYASLNRDEFELQVDGRRQLGMGGAEGPQFDGLS